VIGVCEQITHKRGKLGLSTVAIFVYTHSSSLSSIHRSRMRWSNILERAFFE